MDARAGFVTKEEAFTLRIEWAWAKQGHDADEYCVLTMETRSIKGAAACCRCKQHVMGQQWRQCRRHVIALFNAVVIRTGLCHRTIVTLRWKREKERATRIAITCIHVQKVKTWLCDHIVNQRSNSCVWQSCVHVQQATLLWSRRDPMAILLGTRVAPSPVELARPDGHYLGASLTPQVSVELARSDGKSTHTFMHAAIVRVC